MSRVLAMSNLKNIREYKGITTKELSQKSYISEDKIIAFENESENIDLECLMRICNALGCRKEDLNKNDTLNGFKTSIFFRNQGYINKKEELAYVQKCRMIYRIYRFLSCYLRLPKLDKIDLDRKNIGIVAKLIRDKWEIGELPICNMVSLLENKGFLVCNVNPGKQKVQAFSQSLYKDEEKVFIISIGNDNKSAATRNYDLAHELAHCILHKDINPLDLNKDKFDKLEEEAIEFASEFLLPKESFMNDLIYPNDLDFYIELKSKWIVPIKLLIKRAYKLGAISSRKYEYFIKEMKSRGWDKKEPLDNNIKISNPVLCKIGIDILLENKIMNTSNIMKNLKDYGVFIDSYEVEKLIGMKSGSLNSEDITKKSNILTLRR